MKADTNTTARVLQQAALGLAVVAYAVFLVLNSAPIAGGADSSGYLNSARLLAEGRWTASPRPIGTLPREALPPHIDRPLGFRPSLDGSFLEARQATMAILAHADVNGLTQRLEGFLSTIGSCFHTSPCKWKNQSGTIQALG